MANYTVVAGETVTGIVLNVLDAQNVYGTAVNTTINSASDQYIWSGGIARNTIINAGGEQHVYGTANNTIDNSQQRIFDGGIANGTKVTALQYVERGGTANNTTITDAGSQTIYSGGAATSTTIDHGFQTVDSGATATDTIINGSALRFAHQRVYGTVTNTTINGDGEQYVEDRGTAKDTIINDRGEQYLFGTATSTTINDGIQHVVGTAINTIINAGGRQDVLGTAKNTTVNGGFMHIYGNASVAGTIILGGGGILQIDQTFAGAPSFAAPLVNIDVGDVIDLQGLSYSAGRAPEFSGSQLTVSNAFSSAQFTLVTPQATHFIASSDGFGGTLLTAAAMEAHDDAYVVQQGQMLMASIGVLSNDDGATTTALLVGPSHGTLQLAANGIFTYTPAANFSGIDSFSYHASGGAYSADAQVPLYVVPIMVGPTTTLNLLALNAEQQIAATYTAFFGRAADAGGHGFWVGQFVQNQPTQGAAALFANIASSFGISDEAKALYPFLVDPFHATDAQISAFLDSVYNNLFNRSSDAGGLAYWTGAIKATLQAGQFVGSVLVNIMSGAQDSAAGKDITTLMGKVAVSLEYVHEQQEHGTVWAPATDTAAATNLLRTVTSDAASVLVGVKNAEMLIANHA